MFKRFLLKQAMKSQLKGVPEADQEMLLDLVERNPAFFENLAKEIQEATADPKNAGKDSQAIMMEIMMKHKAELSELVKK